MTTPTPSLMPPPFAGGLTAGFVSRPAGSRTPLPQPPDPDPGGGGGQNFRAYGFGNNRLYSFAGGRLLAVGDA